MDRNKLAEKYFDGLGVYSLGNMGIVSLLSDVQEMVSMYVPESNHGGKSHYVEILNDIKRILISEDKKNDVSICDVSKVQQISKEEFFNGKFSQ